MKQAINSIAKFGQYYDEQDFCRDAKRYINAVARGGMLVSIGSVSKSGMSRTMKFVELRKGMILNFYKFFEALGHQKIANSDYFRINGCGMDMVFHTNYTIMHQLANVGLITKKRAKKLAQKDLHLI